MTLATAGLILGSCIVLANLPLLAAPATARRMLAAFPRSQWLGWILAIVAIAWSAWLVNEMELGSFNKYKIALYVVAPVLLVLVCFFMEELLAVRALGGLLMLVPAPLLDIARWHDSSSRLVVTVLAYVMVVAGMTLILCPYVFRKTAERFTATDLRCRLSGGAGFVLGAVVVALALKVY